MKQSSISSFFARRQKEDTTGVREYKQEEDTTGVREYKQEEEFNDPEVKKYKQEEEERKPVFNFYQERTGLCRDRVDFFI